MLTQMYGMTSNAYDFIKRGMPIYNMDCQWFWIDTLPPLGSFRHITTENIGVFYEIIKLLDKAVAIVQM